MIFSSLRFRPEKGRVGLVFITPRLLHNSFFRLLQGVFISWSMIYKDGYFKADLAWYVQINLRIIPRRRGIIHFFYKKTIVHDITFFAVICCHTALI